MTPTPTDLDDRLRHAFAWRAADARTLVADDDTVVTLAPSQRRPRRPARVVLAMVAAAAAAAAVVVAVAAVSVDGRDGDDELRTATPPHLATDGLPRVVIDGAEIESFFENVSTGIANPPGIYHAVSYRSAPTERLQAVTIRTGPAGSEANGDDDRRTTVTTPLGVGRMRAFDTDGSSVIDVVVDGADGSFRLGIVGVAAADVEDALGSLVVDATGAAVLDPPPPGLHRVSGGAAAAEPPQRMAQTIVDVGGDRLLVDVRSVGGYGAAGILHAGAGWRVERVAVAGTDEAFAMSFPDSDDGVLIWQPTATSVASVQLDGLPEGLAVIDGIRVVDEMTFGALIADVPTATGPDGAVATSATATTSTTPGG